MLKIVPTHNQVQYGSADSLTYEIYSGGVASNPTAATYKVYWGTEEKASGSGAISTNTITISFDGSEFSGPVTNARVALTTTTATESKVTNHLFSVVRYKLNNEVIDADLQARVPNLVDKLWSGTTSYDTQISEAFTTVIFDITKRGYDENSLVDTGDFNQAVIWKSLEIIMFGFYRSTDDVWRDKYEEAKSKYDSIISSMVFHVDESLDGVPSSEPANMSSIRCIR